MSTMKDRSEDYTRKHNIAGIGLCHHLAEFGQQERERAVKECAEAYRRCWHYPSNPGTIEEVQAAILAVAKPEPEWCAHWKYSHEDVWRATPEGSDCGLPIYTTFKHCPECGKPRPK